MSLKYNAAKEPKDPIEPLDPFDVLIELERQCRLNALAIPQEKIAGRIWQGIGFIAANIHLVSPLGEILEILPVPSITPLPQSVSWFKGVASLRGRILPINDLQGLLTNKNQEITHLSRVLIINYEKNEIGFLVQQVLGVQRFYENSLKSNVGETIDSITIDSTIRSYLQGQFEEKQTWGLISLKTLCQTPQFYQILEEMGA